MSYDYSITIESNQKLSNQQIRHIKELIDQYGDEQTDWGFTAVKGPRNSDDYEEG